MEGTGIGRYCLLNKNPIYKNTENTSEMETNDKQLIVSALENGTVLDHIPADQVYKALDILDLKGADHQITIGINLKSKQLGRKGIIKIADRIFADDDLNRLALIAPKATVNIIRNFKVVEKKKLDQKFYFDLTRGDFDREEEAQMRAVSLYWPHLPIRVMEILPSSGSEEVTEKKREKARKKTEEFLMKQNVIYNSISFPKKDLILFQEPGRPGAFEKELETFRENLVRTVKQEYHILVSGRAESYLKVAEADRQLGELRRLTGIPTVEEKTLWWEQMRYEELLLQISRLPEVQSYIEERFRNLVEYDQKHGARLLWTLEELMQNNGSRKETAEKLFLHRNTMAYRVKKIEEILGCSLGDPRTVQELAFLCKMREYQNI